MHKVVEDDLIQATYFLERAASFLNEAVSYLVCAEVASGDDIVMARKVRHQREAVQSRASETVDSNRQLIEFIERYKASEAALDVLYPKAV
jgi:hypothetical protein